MSRTYSYSSEDICYSKSQNSNVTIIAINDATSSFGEHPIRNVYYYCKFSKNGIEVYGTLPESDLTLITKFEQENKV